MSKNDVFTFHCTLRSICMYTIRIGMSYLEDYLYELLSYSIISVAL